MTQLEQFIKDLRELAVFAPPTVICMPPNSVGLPEGKFILDALLKYIADCLEGKVS